MKYLMLGLLCGALTAGTLSYGQNSGKQDRNKDKKDYEMTQTDSSGNNKKRNKNRKQDRNTSQQSQQDSMPHNGADSARNGR